MDVFYLPHDNLLVSLVEYRSFHFNVDKKQREQFNI